MTRDEGSAGLVSTRNLAAAVAVVASGAGFAGLPTAAQARVYYGATCTPPKVNEAGTAIAHPAGTSGWDWGWADTGCGANMAGIPCVGFNPPSAGNFVCPSYSTRTYSVREFYTVGYKAFVRLCGFCDGKTYTNNHDVEASSTYFT